MFLRTGGPSRALKEARLIDPSGVFLFLTYTIRLTSYFHFLCDFGYYRKIW